jgi:hypothetical protein
MADRFPSPFEMPTPPGAEGWQDLYAYSSVFSEDRREYEESQFWFMDGVHSPEAIPPWDATIVEYALIALSQYNTRHYVIPPARGVDLRFLNGYMYLSPVGVADPKDDELDDDCDPDDWALDDDEEEPVVDTPDDIAEIQLVDLAGEAAESALRRGARWNVAKRSSSRRWAWHANTGARRRRSARFSEAPSNRLTFPTSGPEQRQVEPGLAYAPPTMSIAARTACPMNRTRGSAPFR